MAQGHRDQQPQTKRDGPGNKESSSELQGKDRGAAQESDDTRSGLARGGSDIARSSEVSSFGGLSSPFGMMRRFMEDLDRITGGSIGGLSSAWTPQVEMFREGDDVVIRADVPGMSAEDLDVEIEDDVLTIAGERRSEGREEREGFFRSERSYGWFERSIRLPEGTDPEKIDARLEEGVLELRINAPMEERRARKIPIGAKGEVAEESGQQGELDVSRSKHDTH